MYLTFEGASERVVGLTPSRPAHQTFLGEYSTGAEAIDVPAVSHRVLDYVGVEPYSGTTYYSHQRIQINVQVSTQYFEHGRSRTQLVSILLAVLTAKCPLCVHHS